MYDVVRCDTMLYDEIQCETLKIETEHIPKFLKKKTKRGVAPNPTSSAVSSTTENSNPSATNSNMKKNCDENHLKMREKYEFFESRVFLSDFGPKVHI